jgi:hypothetical protein
MPLIKLPDRKYKNVTIKLQIFDLDRFLAVSSERDYAELPQARDLAAMAPGARGRGILEAEQNRYSLYHVRPLSRRASSKIRAIYAGLCYGCTCFELSWRWLSLSRPSLSLKINFSSLGRSI